VTHTLSLTFKQTKLTLLTLTKNTHISKEKKVEKLIEREQGGQEEERIALA